MTETLLIEILFTFNNTIKFQVNKNWKKWANKIIVYQAETYFQKAH